jgi:glycosyltransferase involved in cell wall biosynthesis
LRIKASEYGVADSAFREPRTVISVIVCTVDRGHRLDACFDALAESAAISSTPLELIVVDNGSVDDTRRVVARWSQASKLPTCYVVEQKRGLSRARNAGIAAARHPILAFTDDDCLVAPSWVSAIGTEFRDLRLDVLGGRVTLHDPSDRPVAIRPSESPATIDDLNGINEYLVGCNMAMRRSVFTTLGGFDERLGAGSDARSAEDTDLLYRCVRRGMSVRFSPEMHVRHAHGRRSDADIASLGSGYIRGRGAFYVKHAVRGDLRAIKHLYWELRTLPAKQRRTLLSGGFRYMLRA